MPTVNPGVVINPISVGVSAGASRLARAVDLRQAEVEHLGPTIARDEDVRRLDVTVHDAPHVRGLERIGNLDGEIEDLRELERLPVPQPVAQGLAFEQLHGQQRLAIGVIDLVDGADVRVVQRRGGARLALEALEREVVARELRRQELERDVAPQLRVVGAYTTPIPPEPICSMTR